MYLRKGICHLKSAVIRKDNWCFGELRSNQNRMCALGQYYVQCGIPIKNLTAGIIPIQYGVVQRNDWAAKALDIDEEIVKQYALDIALANDPALEYMITLFDFTNVLYNKFTAEEYKILLTEHRQAAILASFKHANINIEWV